MQQCNLYIYAFLKLPFRENLYFTVQPEKMMIKIEHAVLATKFLTGKLGGKDLAASQRNMKGYLYGHNGTLIKRYSV